MISRVKKLSLFDDLEFSKAETFVKMTEKRNNKKAVNILKVDDKV